MAGAPALLLATILVLPHSSWARFIAVSAPEWGVVGEVLFPELVVEGELPTNASVHLLTDPVGFVRIDNVTTTPTEGNRTTIRFHGLRIYAGGTVPLAVVLCGVQYPVVLPDTNNPKCSTAWEQDVVLEQPPVTPSPPAPATPLSKTVAKVVLVVAFGATGAMVCCVVVGRVAIVAIRNEAWPPGEGYSDGSVGTSSASELDELDELDSLSEPTTSYHPVAHREFQAWDALHSGGYPTRTPAPDGNLYDTLLTDNSDEVDLLLNAVEHIPPHIAVASVVGFSDRPRPTTAPGTSGLTEDISDLL